MIQRGAVIIVVAGCWATAWAGPASDYEMLFGAEARKAAATRDGRDDAALGARVLAAAKMAPDAPQSQVYFYRKAYELGVGHASGQGTAIEAAELLMAAAPKERRQWQGRKLGLLESAYRQARGVTREAAARAYLDGLLDAAEDASAARRPDEAKSLYEKAHPVAKYLQSPVAGQIAKKIKEADALAGVAAKRDETLKRLMARVAEAPRDMKARTELILFCVIELNAPQKAATLLAKGVDEELAARVRSAAKAMEAVSEAECIDLGRWYYESLVPTAPAVSQAALLRRAVAYYERYLALHTKQDVGRLTAKMTLEEIRAKLARLTSGAPVAGKVKGTLLVAGGGRHELRINGSSVPKDVELRAGDVITVRAQGGRWQPGFCLLFEAEGGVGFGTNPETWFSYVPKDKARWWRVEAASRSPVTVGRGRPLRRGVRGHGQGPPVSLYLPIRGEGQTVFLCHTVGAEELASVRWVSRDASYTVSSKSEINGQPFEPMAALLTGQGRLGGNNELAFQTREEFGPHIVVTLGRAARVRRILIENRRGHHQDRAAGLTVWLSTDRTQWKRTWTASRVQPGWQVDLVQGAEARYVKIGLSRPGILHLASVRVYE